MAHEIPIEFVWKVWKRWWTKFSFLKSGLTFCCLPGTALGSATSGIPRLFLQQNPPILPWLLQHSRTAPLLPHEGCKASYSCCCWLWKVLFGAVCAVLHRSRQKCPKTSWLQYLEREGRGKEGFWCPDCSPPFKQLSAHPWIYSYLWRLLTFIDQYFILKFKHQKNSISGIWESIH